MVCTRGIVTQSHNTGHDRTEFCRVGVLCDWWCDGKRFAVQGTTLWTGREQRQHNWAQHVPTDRRRQSTPLGIAFLVDSGPAKVESVSSEQRDDRRDDSGHSHEVLRARHVPTERYSAMIICLCSSSKVLICAFELFRSSGCPDPSTIFSVWVFLENLLWALSGFLVTPKTND